VDLVIQTGLGQTRVELLDLLHRDSLVPAEQAEQRRADVAGPIERALDAETSAGQHAVEADHRRQVRDAGGRASKSTHIRPDRIRV